MNSVVSIRGLSVLIHERRRTHKRSFVVFGMYENDTYTLKNGDLFVNFLNIKILYVLLGILLVCLVRTMYSICKVRGSNSFPKKKTFENMVLNFWYRFVILCDLRVFFRCFTIELWDYSLNHVHRWYMVHIKKIYKYT